MCPTLILRHTLVFLPPVSTAENCRDQCFFFFFFLSCKRSHCVLLNVTWFLRVLSVLLDSSPCMHSCDVSPCVGSRGAWSEVHVGQCESAVVMTIILLINVLRLKRWLGAHEGEVFSTVFCVFFCFAWRGSCYSRAELLCSPPEIL